MNFILIITSDISFQFIKGEGITTSTWNKKWIQSGESLWGIVEKYKFANSINGKTFFNLFTNNTISNYTGRSSYSRMQYLSYVKLHKEFGFEWSNHTEKYLIQFKIFNYNLLPANLMHKELFFCKECLANGFHSILHQLMIVLYCPYHPKEMLTRKCPECSNVFRGYGIGYKENAFTCQSCNTSILNSEKFIQNMQYWFVELEFKYPLKDLLNLKRITDEKIYFLFSNRYKVDDINVIYNKLPYLLNNIYKVQKLAYSVDKYQTFQLTYPLTNARYMGYNLKALMNKRPINAASITDVLNQVLFTQSKAIFKSVERYILKHLNKTTNMQIKKCYGNNGFIKQTKFKHPFIEWKNECYGEWIYNIKYEKNITYNHRSPIYVHGKQIFPYLSHIEKFQDNFDLQMMETKSFSTLINTFSKMLFHYLYSRFLEISNNYSKHQKYFLSPSIIVNDNKKIFYLSELDKIK
ncbi:hypothetical protein [Planococcus soli]|uniref:hypothetical protein n=1 Tax=Planococcus soli TaxID=2666072 RepID=UPI00115CEE38|nr:hypothetical protein [Planococcus soli]